MTSLLGVPKFGRGVCISRVLAFLDAEGINGESLAQRSIAVVGSNGKGSTARLTAGALSGAGLRVGCFTSPHLYTATERFRIGEQTMTEEEFRALSARVLAYAERLPEEDRMGAFEVLFCMAALWFSEQWPDAIVWEAGIGGRYDPVRVVRARTAALTSLELEHAELLGPTEELIAFDKIDVLAGGGRLFVSGSVDERHYSRIAAFCRLRDIGVTFARRETGLSEVSHAPSGTSFRLSQVGGGECFEVRLGLVGDHQAHNAASAFLLSRRFLPEADPYRLLSGIASVRWPGRLERVAHGPDLWIDVGHTPGALSAVMRAYTEIADPRRTLLVFGASQTKAFGAMAEIAAAAQFARIILTRAFKDGVDPSLLAAHFPAERTVLARDTAEAAALAKTLARSAELSVLATGGLYLAAEIRMAWEGLDPASLVHL